MAELIDTAEADAFRKGREAGRKLLAKGIGQDRLHGVLEAAEAGLAVPGINPMVREEMSGLASLLRDYFAGKNI
jgi:hypothetical protein